MTTRADIVRAARAYVGTPFQHQQRTPGVALDCAGVLICVARELGLVAAGFDINGYGRAPDGRLHAWLAQYMTPVAREAMQPGDALELIVDAEPQHLGILGDWRRGGLSLIHAVHRRDGKGAVIETRLMFARDQRFVAAWAFPGIA